MTEAQARQQFNDAQVNHDLKVAERNLTQWVLIIQKKMNVATVLEDQKEPQILRKLVDIFYNHMVEIDMQYQDVRIKYESLTMLLDEALIYANEIMRINQAFFNRSTLGPNQQRYMETLQADVYATKTRLDEMEEPIGFDDLYKSFVESVNEYTGNDFANVSKMIDEYQYYPDGSLNVRSLTIIKKGRNAWAHPEEDRGNRDTLISNAAKEMNRIINEINN